MISICHPLVTDAIIEKRELYVNSREDMRISLMGGCLATDAQIDHVLSTKHYAYCLEPYSVRGTRGKQAFIETGILEATQTEGMWLVHDVRGYADVLQAVNNELYQLVAGELRVIVTASPTKESSAQNWRDELGFALIRGGKLVRDLTLTELGAIQSKIDRRLVGDRGSENLVLGLLS